MQLTDRIYTDVNEALEHIYSERARFVALAVRYVENRDEAEDIFQNCAIDLMKAMRGDSQIKNLDAYFARAVKNRCHRSLQHRDYVSEMTTLMQVELEYLSHSDNFADDKKLDCAAMLQKCRERLPRLAFEVYEEKKFNGLDYKTIARKFNITERRVNTEIQKAQKVFREEFRGYSPQFIMALAFMIIHKF